MRVNHCFKISMFPDSEKERIEQNMNVYKNKLVELQTQNQFNEKKEELKRQQEGQEQQDKSR